jgi:FHA domain
VTLIALIALGLVVVAAWRRQDDLKPLLSAVASALAVVVLGARPDRVQREVVRSAVASAMPSPTRLYVPNEVRVGLAPALWEAWQPLLAEFCQELCDELSSLSGTAAPSGLTYFIVRPRVEFYRDADARPARPTILCSFSEGTIISRPPSEPDETPPLSGNGLVLIVEGDARPRRLRDGDRIGRSKECEQRVTSPEVSRVHARVGVRSGETTICDLATPNGTWVNDRRLPPHEPVAVREGDQLRFGDVRAGLRLVELAR